MTAASDNIACQEDPHDRDAERAAALPGHEPMTRMRAVICRAFGDVEGLKVEEVTAPTPKPGEVLIAVKATAVNYADALMTAGRYQTKPDPPFRPGLVAAGDVARSGLCMSRQTTGDRGM